ncbi:hypothetical protein BDW60DRAFT_198648 [Aspergillus nidulans var. acristatus]
MPTVRCRCTTASDLSCTCRNRSTSSSLLSDRLHFQGESHFVKARETPVFSIWGRSMARNCPMLHQLTSLITLFHLTGLPDKYLFLISWEKIWGNGCCASIPAEILRAGKELTDFISTGGSMFLF